MPPRPKKTAGTVVLGSDAAASTRLRAVAALHQPIVRRTPGSSVRGVVLEEASEDLVCGECKVADRYGSSLARAPWPCATARLAGTWPFVEDDRG